MTASSIQTIADIRAAMTEGLTAVEICAQYLERIAAHDGPLHAFTHVATEQALARAESIDRRDPHDPDLPDFDVYIHDHGETIDYPSHYEPGADRYHSSIVHPPPPYREVQVKAPEGTRLPTTYEAVH